MRKTYDVGFSKKNFTSSESDTGEGELEGFPSFFVTSYRLPSTLLRCGSCSKHEPSLVTYRRTPKVTRCVNPFEEIHYLVSLLGTFILEVSLENF